VKLNPKELHLAKCRAAEKWNEVERRKASSQQPVVVGLLPSQVVLLRTLVSTVVVLS
jgi:hypothetical protein